MIRDPFRCAPKPARKSPPGNASQQAAIPSVSQKSAALRIVKLLIVAAPRARRESGAFAPQPELSPRETPPFLGLLGTFQVGDSLAGFVALRNAKMAGCEPAFS
jgi:hypothetical protein